MNKLETMEEFVTTTEELITDGATHIGVYIKLPDLEKPELIINPITNWETKLNYYVNTYNEKLGHDRVPNLHIVGVDSFEIEPTKNVDITFGEAINYLKAGYKVRRKGWNGKGIFIKLQNPDVSSKMTHPYIYIDTTGLQTDNPDAPKDRVPWLASQTDMLAEDWEVINNE